MPYIPGVLVSAAAATAATAGSDGRAANVHGITNVRLQSMSSRIHGPILDQTHVSLSPVLTKTIPVVLHGWTTASRSRLLTDRSTATAVVIVNMRTISRGRSTTSCLRGNGHSPRTFLFVLCTPWTGYILAR